MNAPQKIPKRTAPPTPKKRAGPKMPRGRPAGSDSLDALPADHLIKRAMAAVPARAQLMALMGVSTQVLTNLINRAAEGKPLAPQHVLTLCRITGDRPFDWRPDIFEPHWKCKRVKPDKPGAPVAPVAPAE